MAFGEILDYFKVEEGQLVDFYDSGGRIIPLPPGARGIILRQEADSAATTWSIYKRTPEGFQVLDVATGVWTTTEDLIAKALFEKPPDKSFKDWLSSVE